MTFNTLFFLGLLVIAAGLILRLGRDVLRSTRREREAREKLEAIREQMLTARAQQLKDLHEITKRAETLHLQAVDRERVIKQQRTQYQVLSAEHEALRMKVQRAWEHARWLAEHSDSDDVRWTELLSALREARGETVAKGSFEDLLTGG